MRIRIILSLLCLSIFCFSAYYIFNENSSSKRMPKAERIEALAEQEFLMTRDPATNQIPKEQIYTAKQRILKGEYRTGTTLNWEERGPNNFGGRTRALAFDPSDPSGNTIWAGGVAGGLWKCSNAFTDQYRWERIDSYTGNSAISSIVIDPTDHDVIYVGTGEGWFNADAYVGDGIFRSLNGGKSWTRLTAGNDVTYRFIQKLMISGDRLFACTRDGGIQMSIDRGESWTKSLGNGQFGFSERAGDIDKGADGSLWACMGFGTTVDGIYKSTDNGDTWDFIELPGSVFRRSELALAPSNPKVAYVLKENPSSNAVEEIMKTTNGGVSWEILEAPSAIGMDYFSRNQAWYDLSIAVDPTDENRLFIGGVDLILSEDGGKTWTQISQWFGGQGIQFVHADQHFAQYLDNTGERMAFTNDGGIYLTDDAKSSFPVIDWKNQDYNTIQFYACAVHPTNKDWILGGTQDNGTHLFETAGMNATARVTGGDGSYCHIDRDNPNIQISSYIYNTYNVTFNSWGSSDNYNLGYRAGSFINPTDYDDDNDVLICSGEESQLFLLDIHTGAFDSIIFSQINGSRISAIKVDPNDNTKVYLGSASGAIFRVDSLVQGKPRITELLSVAGNLRNFDIDPNNPDRILAIISNSNVPSVFISSDGGLSWENQDGDMPGIPIRWGVFNPVSSQSVILATELGIWTTDQTDGDYTLWSYNSEGLPVTRVDMLDVRTNDFTLVAATHGRGMFTTNLCSGMVDNDNDGFACDNDCNDFDANINADQLEIPYNGIDDDCNSATPDDDIDQDGFLAVDDCDDNDPALNPNAEEIEGNGIDENCDGLDEIPACESYETGPWSVYAGAGICYGGPISSSWSVWSNESYFVNSLRDGISYYFDHCNGYDEGVFESMLSIYYYNRIDDSRGALIASKDSCRIEFEYVGNVDYPDVLIIIHDINDCHGNSTMLGNGLGEFGCLSTGIDNDNDGVTSEIDCDDMNADISPNLTEIAYNGIDDDCDPSTPDDDIDGDGFGIDEDCDDAIGTINPGMDEIPFNGIDDDCDPSTLDNDIDGDGYNIFEDCDESDPNINPGAFDIPGNGIDEDCDGEDATTATHDLGEHRVNIYPNPSSGMVWLDAHANLDYRIEIYSPTGQLLIVKNRVKQVDLSGHAEGIYLIKLIDENTGRFVIEALILSY